MLIVAVFLSRTLDFGSFAMGRCAGLVDGHDSIWSDRYGTF
jgi:hypothetical protein